MEDKHQSPAAGRERADLLIVGGTMITMDATRRIIKDAAMAIRADKIIFVGKRVDAEQCIEADEVINGSKFVITPGFIDGHVHITGDPLTRGYVPDEIDVGFEEKLNRWVIPRYHAHTAEDERLSAQLAALEMLRSGTTCFLEAGTIRHLDAVVDGLNASGIRGRVGSWVEGRAFDPAENQTVLIDEAIQQLENEVTHYPANVDNNIAAWPLLVGHSTNPDEVWLAAKALADTHGLGISAHMSPYATDAEWFLANTGRRPIEHLADIGALGDNVSLTHVVHINKSELEKLTETNTNVIHCSIAAMKDACGITSVGLFPEMAKAGINILLGTDGYSSDLMHTMKITTAIFKDARQNFRLFPAHEALTMATLNGAKALQLENEIGSLEVGKKADFVLHDTQRAEWQPMHNVVNQLVWSADGRGVHSVWVNGIRLIDNYHSTVVDEAALYRQAQIAGEAIIKRSGVPFVCPWPVE
jgi:5-methylthioadenosine/S-adenosylhomocysteine deaminase